MSPGLNKGKRPYYLRYSGNRIFGPPRAGRGNDAFRERYRLRAGIEATFSDLDRLTGFKRLRYRGLKRVRMSIQLKVLGLNIPEPRPGLLGSRRNGGNNRPGKGLLGACLHVFKELMPRILLLFPPLWSFRRIRASTSRCTLAVTCSLNLFCFLYEAIMFDSREFCQFSVDLCHRRAVSETIS